MVTVSAVATFLLLNRAEVEVMPTVSLPTKPDRP